jgi:hypothetical protein
MAAEITRMLKPEEEEVLRKRAELTVIQATLAERELELTDLQSQLAAFEGRHHREVGTIYAELDEWKARIAELRAKLDPSIDANKMAEEAREQARSSYEAAHGEASKSGDFAASPELKSLFREVAKKTHPDFARNSADRERRTKLMAEANIAYRAGNYDDLCRILDEGYELKDDPSEGIGAELIRLIRQISQAKERVANIERELAALRQSEIAELWRDCEKAKQLGRDLLFELAAAGRRDVQLVREEYARLRTEVNRS